MPRLTGDALRTAILTATTTRPPLVDEFLYERNVLLLAGEPGCGKSTVAMQTAMALSAGHKVFAGLNVPTPRRVYYLQLEGSLEESMETVHRMEQKIPVEPKNLCWDFRTDLNLLNLDRAAALREDIAGWGEPELLTIDPLYQSVFGELSSELPVKALLRFMDSVRERFTTCAIMLIHHTKKPSYDSQGRRIQEDDPFYGSQWLKAYVDTSFLLRVGSGPHRDHVFLINKKDRYSACLKELVLHYDPETEALTMEVPFEEQSNYERVVRFLAELKRQGKTTHFFEVLAVTKTSNRHLRRIQMTLLTKGLLRCNKVHEHKKVWEPL